MAHDDDNLGDESYVPRRANSPPPEQRRRWIKWEISLGDIALAFAIATPFLVWAKDVDKRLAVIETAQTMQLRIDAAQDQIGRDSMREIKDDVRSIKDYLLNSPRRVVQ